ncbi:MAG: hypothetical protein GVX90_00275 [Alphaproteobacteria bacterium]|nr:hypothetical protein [Alphaproteobacteria bacterium]
MLSPIECSILELGIGHRSTTVLERIGHGSRVAHRHVHVERDVEQRERHLEAQGKAPRPPAGNARAGAELFGARENKDQTPR